MKQQGYRDPNNKRATATSSKAIYMTLKVNIATSWSTACSDHPPCSDWVSAGLQSQTAVQVTCLWWTMQILPMLMFGRDKIWFVNAGHFSLFYNFIFNENVVLVRGGSDDCKIRAHAYPSMRKNNPPYNLMVRTGQKNVFMVLLPMKAYVQICLNWFDFIFGISLLVNFVLIFVLRYLFTSCYSFICFVKHSVLLSHICLTLKFTVYILLCSIKSMTDLLWFLMVCMGKAPVFLVLNCHDIHLAIHYLVSILQGGWHISVLCFRD